MQLRRTSPEWSEWVADKMAMILHRADDPKSALEIAKVVLAEARTRTIVPPIELIGVDELEDHVTEIIECSSGCVHCKVVAMEMAVHLGFV